MGFVVGITGASGAEYAYRLLEHLRGGVELIISEDAEKVIKAETGWTPDEFRELAKVSYDNHDFNAPVASGSHLFEAMVIVPCSMNTLTKIALGMSDNLITRAASVTLKEGRKLILVPRETPLHTLQLEHMLKASRLGAIILPAMPGFYHRPTKMEDLVDFIVARILDQLGVEHQLIPRWGSEARKAFTRPDE
jgi:4-hydroxy-3-polyprenylbenzoate decarboxylase